MNTDAQTGAESSDAPLMRADVELLRDKAESSVGLEMPTSMNTSYAPLLPDHQQTRRYLVPASHRPATAAVVPILRGHLFRPGSGQRAYFYER